ncbi:hypothetical protein GRS96_18850 [Rathayibacter sp. VKM Ac-2803]|uniref:hypothetical protein n=1 Tax=unclassified Rathayibacter TaxID=2609250 RepID=UPI0013579DC8|nr:MULTISPECIES: hypothetical protein [unclassified Rathayibacter]MWV51334.1 hypothetical protein [Rathayibacter sp. VKM Ac-2803]MWV57809.1 hypothetical protein [Rathayibacter sp. VKM Ac-2754]
MSTKLWLTLGAVVAAGLGVGALVVFSWAIDETHFDRPDEGFDRLTAQVEAVPSATVDGSERWVEVSSFVTPTSWIGLTVEEAGLADLLDVACTTAYPDPVTWSVRVRTDGGSTVSVHSPAQGARASAGCPDFGLDVEGVLDVVDSTMRGVELQAAIREDGRLALVALEEPSGGVRTLLPLVARAEDLRDAAGLDATRLVEVNSATLILVVEPGEQERYGTVLDRLVEDHGVTSFWADGGGTPIDGVDKVQIVAPDAEHDAIEEALRDSDLHVADLPVRFLPLEP